MSISFHIEDSGEDSRKMRTGGNMHSLNLKISDDQHDRLRKIGYENKVSIASIVRKMLQDGLDAYELDTMPKEE